MSKILTKKIEAGELLKVSDLTPDQKKSLYAMMVRRGASEAFGYDRFFKCGFAHWELTGIDSIKRQFMTDHLPELLTIESDVTAALKDQSVRDTIIDTIGAFWELINQVKGLQQKLVDEMATQGMGRTSVLNHFKADDWKLFQRQGIVRVWADFCEEEGIE